MSQKSIKGISASSGTAKAEALVIASLLSIPPVPKVPYIVVAPYTTPLLNLILLKAKGIVCETGGLTTHAAIIARELKIPCVMSAKGILDEVITGQLIEINADAAEVIIYANE